MKKISEVTGDVKVVSSGHSIQDAAKLMAGSDVGSLPVSDNDQLVGMITDRDMVLRVLAKGLGADTKVGDVMSKAIKHCRDDEDVATVAKTMADLGVRRLPVVNVDKRLVGIVALSNIAQSGNQQASVSLLDSVAQPH